jgi:hypothetical protein
MTSNPKPPTPEQCAGVMDRLMEARKAQGLYTGDYYRTGLGQPDGLLPVAEFRQDTTMPDRGVDPITIPRASNMAKRKAANPKPKAEKKQPTKNPKEPVMPFGDELPNASKLGSPADGNWKPTGQQLQDVSALESQEKFLYRMMTKAKAHRDLAKAQCKLSIAEADETSVSDGAQIEEKVRLHKSADSASSRANKAEKEYKRARDGWNAVKQTLHRYLTEPEKPLFDQKNKKGGKAA